VSIHTHIPQQSFDVKYFYRTCDFYYGTTTFEEAFERTGKHVCITVSASRASGGTAQRLLLNHISTPHVTLASAVAASCALPGVMKPAKLQIKNNMDEMEPFEVDGVEWIDGSVQADLPFQRISTLFNVSNYIVCQTNFHVVPFLNKEYHPNSRSTYWKLFQTIEWDIRNRCLKLSKLGLFPRIFGQDISKVFKQKYHGHLTLVPRFTTAQTFGLKALVNPSVKEMDGYLKYGQLAAWPYLG
jgi:TAG lipase/steryl ester hydrolase/phospholipase A2/LPA acyltransferase